jgi:hypothetical protein
MKHEEALPIYIEDEYRHSQWGVPAFKKGWYCFAGGGIESDNPYTHKGYSREWLRGFNACRRWSFNRTPKTTAVHNDVSNPIFKIMSLSVIKDDPEDTVYDSLQKISKLAHDWLISNNYIRMVYE